MFSKFEGKQKKMSTIFISYLTSVLWVGEIFGFWKNRKAFFPFACMVSVRWGGGGAEYLPVFPSH